MRFRLALLPILFSNIALATEFKWQALPAPPKIDGTIDVDEWRGAAQASGLVDAEQNTPFPEQSTFFIASDDKYIYFAARVADSDPGRIVADEYRPNSSLGGEDSVSLRLDLNENLTASNRFTFNARGANSIGISGGRAAKTEWLGEVLSKARITADGWEVEARIPWQILRLPPAGPRTMRVNFTRYLPRNQRDGVHVYTGEGRAENTPRWSGVPVPEADQSQVLQLLPYAVAGANRDKTIFNTGVDARTRITDDIEAVASLNPDFRNIESSILSLDFSYFERLAGDNRPFFQEGSGFFSVGWGPTIFASQRIRSFDFGAKVVGRIDDKTEFGVLNTTTFQEENATVVSVSHQPTSRSNMDFGFANLERGKLWNRALFLNYGQGVRDTFWYAQAYLTDDSNLGEAGRAAFGFSSGKPTFSWGFDGVWSDRDFRPRLGSVRDTDLKGSNAWASYNRVLNSGAVSEYGITGSANSYWRLDGDPYRRGAEVNVSLTMRSALDIDFGTDISRFEEFDDQITYFSIEWPRRARTRSWEASTSWGHLSGRPYRSTSLGVRLRPERTFDVGLSLQQVNHFNDRTQFIGSFNLDLKQDRAIGGRVLARDGDWGGYLSFRRSGGAGSEYFVILGDPRSEKWRNAIAVKWVTPFSIKF